VWGGNQLSPRPCDTIRLLIADDHAIVREGLRRMLGGTEILVAAEAATGSEAVELARRLEPDVVLLDIRMPDMDGIAALREIKRERPQIPVVMLTAYDDPTWLVQAVAFGAAGYLLKSLEPAELAASIRGVVTGDALISPCDLAAIIQHLGTEQSEITEPLTGDLSKLTSRECEVLALLVEGLTNHQIADVLGVAASTIKTHVQNVMLKLGASDRTQAAVFAVRAGVGRHG
jgi:DNA-binding NarL/FixJ family response regulator